MPSASGVQFSLKKSSDIGELSAVIESVAAALVSLQINGREFIVPGPNRSRTPFLEGVVMAPWVNRLRDGRWRLGDSEFQVSLTDENTRVANHGLMLDQPFELRAQSEDSVTLVGRLAAGPGYPFDLEISVTYALAESGIRVDFAVLNLSQSPAPFAIGSHPYLQIAPFSTGDLKLTSSARAVILTDDRMLPTQPIATAATNFDLSGGRVLSELHLDNAFTGLGFEGDGLAHTFLQAPDKTVVDLWQSTEFGYLCIFTPHNYPDGNGQKTAVAIEPQTSAADSFNTGEGLIWLQPGLVWRACWGITVGIK